jgi:hypothetical protein
MEQRMDNFRVLKILHLALVAGLTMLLLIALVLHFVNRNHDESLEIPLQVIAIILSVGGLFFGFNQFKKKVAEARNSTEPAEKRLELYRAACIIWWALLEGPGLFATISFILTGNYAFFALGLFHVVVLAIFMPRKENIILLLSLTVDETARLEGKN